MLVRELERAFEASSYDWIQSRYGAAWCKWIEGAGVDLRVAVTLTMGKLRVDVGEFYDSGQKREYSYTVDPEGADNRRVERFILDAERASRDWEREITR